MLRIKLTDLQHRNNVVCILSDWVFNMQGRRLVSCRAVDSGATLFRELHHAVTHRVSCDVDHYDDGAVAAEALLRAIDSVHLLFVRAITPDTLNVSLISTNEFRDLEQTFEAAWRANVRVFSGECLVRAHEVNWSDPATVSDTPPLGPAADIKTVLVHVSKSIGPVIYREISGP
jgi:hypothetical protein